MLFFIVHDVPGRVRLRARYGFSLRNLATGAGIRASGSGQLSHMVLWACPTAACLEPYTPFRVFPGETGVWHIEYELLA